MLKEFPPNSGLPEFDRIYQWPKSETSDFGYSPSRATRSIWAIGVIIGAAFGKIVESLVGDMVMPIFGAIGGLDFSNYYLGLSKAVTAGNLADAKKQGAVLAWGNFLTAVLNFAIAAAALFFVVKGINRLKQKEAQAPAKPASRQEVLLEEIRDLLAKR